MEVSFFSYIVNYGFFTLFHLISLKTTKEVFQKKIKINERRLPQLRPNNSRKLTNLTNNMIVDKKKTNIVIVLMATNQNKQNSKESKRRIKRIMKKSSQKTKL